MVYCPLLFCYRFVFSSITTHLRPRLRITTVVIVPFVIKTPILFNRRLLTVVILHRWLHQQQRIYDNGFDITVVYWPNYFVRNLIHLQPLTYDHGRLRITTVVIQPFVIITPILFNCRLFTVIISAQMKFANSAYTTTVLIKQSFYMKCGIKDHGFG